MNSASPPIPTDRQELFGEPDPAHTGDFGPWTEYRVPADRSGWHPDCRRFYDYWLSVAPAPGQLPGRRHVSPVEIVKLLPRVWMLDVLRAPLRFRYRLVGTAEAMTLGRDLTGQWVDEAHPSFDSNPYLGNRYRFMAATGLPTWRRGPVRWGHDSEHRSVENCMVPLAADGATVDIIFAISVVFFKTGLQVPV